MFRKRDPLPPLFSQPFFKFVCSEKGIHFLHFFPNLFSNLCVQKKGSTSSTFFLTFFQILVWKNRGKIGLWPGTGKDYFLFQFICNTIFTDLKIWNFPVFNLIVFCKRVYFVHFSPIFQIVVWRKRRKIAFSQSTSTELLN